MHDQQMTDPFPSNRQSLNLALMLLRIWSISIEVFVRHSLGVRYPGGWGAAVVLLVPVYCLFWEGYDIVPLFWFLLAYLALCLIHRSNALVRMDRRASGHSYYAGSSRLQWLIPRMDEVQFKTWIEPVLVAAIGLFIAAGVNEPLGYYIVIGSGCMTITMRLCNLQLRSRSMDLHDQVLEQQLVADRFRQGQPWTR